MVVYGTVAGTMYCCFGDIHAKESNLQSSEAYAWRDVSYFLMLHIIINEAKKLLFGQCMLFVNIVYDLYKSCSCCMWL